MALWHEGARRGECRVGLHTVTGQPPKIGFPSKVVGQLLELIRIDVAPVHLQLPRAVVNPQIGGNVVFHGQVEAGPLTPVAGIAAPTCADGRQNL